MLFVHGEKEIESLMRRRGGPIFTPSLRTSTESKSMPLEGTNLEIWIKIENESCNRTSAMMETI